jgi:hypothetical protein
MDGIYQITFSNGDIYHVPLMEIAKNRALNYADEFGGDLERSLQEDTLPLFKSDPYEISDWARNNMYWSDVKGFATYKGKRLEVINLESEWTNGEVEIIEADKM